MDECKPDGSGLVPTKKAVAGELLLGAFERGAQIFGGVAVMMQMHFHFATGGPANFRDAFENGRVVLFDRVKEGVFWRKAVGITEILKPRVIGFPLFYAVQSYGQTGMVERFEVITYRDEDVCDAVDSLTLGTAQIVRKPDVESFEHGFQFFLQRKTIPDNATNHNVFSGAGELPTAAGLCW